MVDSLLRACLDFRDLFTITGVVIAATATTEFHPFFRLKSGILSECFNQVNSNSGFPFEHE